MPNKFQTKSETDNYVSFAFLNDTYVIDNEFDFDFDEFTVMLAKIQKTEITCDICGFSFSLTRPFYTIDSSVAFCLEHLPPAILNEINIPI